MVCPITNTNREFPLHLPLDERTKTTGVIMCEQVRLWTYMQGMYPFMKRHQRIL